MVVSTKPEDVLVTYSLGSCIGLTLYDPSIPVGGMIHCMLPLSRIDPAKAAQAPGMFIDTGVTRLIQNLLNLGALKKRLLAKVAGAASLLDDNGTFRIGERNYVVLRKILWKNDILISAEETGGTITRTLYFYMDSGRVMIRSQRQERELL
jgi:chemotaxis protein CheD